jgi:hypothetical protein
MAECKDCEALEGEPTSIDPHDRLRLDTLLRRSDGDLITYTCLRCGTHWECFCH